MRYLLDTNVVSELGRKEPAPKVAAFFESLSIESVHLSVLTLGELRRGVELLPAGPKRARFAAWLDQELPAMFEDRILPVDAEVSDAWGRLTAKSGRTLPAVDSLIAATALTHGLHLLTRNLKDFEGTGLEVTNPFG